MDRVFDFDEAAFQRLQTLSPNFFENVSEDTETPIEDRKARTYAIYFGNDITPGAANKHRPITGSFESSVVHYFSVFVVAPSPGVRNKLVSKVRQLYLNGEKLIKGVGEIEETGTMNSYADSDATLKPTKYTYMLSFKVTVDRGQ